MRKFLLLAFFSFSQAADNKTSFTDQITISNIGKDTRLLQKGRYTQTGLPTFQGGFRVGSKTIAQLLAYTPSGLYEVWACSNCSPVKLVFSTGTASGNFADLTGGAFK